MCSSDLVDPFAGSYFVESLTDEIEAAATALIDRVDQLGGSVEALAFIIGEIDESAWGYSERYRTGQDIVVGVNRYVDDDADVEDTLRVDPASEQAQVARLAEIKRGRDPQVAERHLQAIRTAAAGSDNLLPVLRDALRERCSVGEVCGAMRDVFGTYRPAA